MVDTVVTVVTILIVVIVAGVKLTRGHQTSTLANLLLSMLWLGIAESNSLTRTGLAPITSSKLHRPKLAQAACVRHACLRAPCVAWPLLLPSFSPFLSPLLLLFLRLLLLTHFGETPVSEIIFAPIFWHN